MTKLLTHFKHNVVAYLALFVALGGTSYAAIRLPAGSVRTRQLHNGAVTNKKLAKGSVGAADLDRKSIAGYVRAFARIDAQGHLISARPTATVPTWRTSGPIPGGTIQWSRSAPKSCATLATTTTINPNGASSASAVTESGPHSAVTYVALSVQQQAVDVAILCSQR